MNAITRTEETVTCIHRRFDAGEKYFKGFKFFLD